MTTRLGGESVTSNGRSGCDIPVSIPTAKAFKAYAEIQDSLVKTVMSVDPGVNGGDSIFVIIGHNAEGIRYVVETGILPKDKTSIRALISEMKSRFKDFEISGIDEGSL